MTEPWPLSAPATVLLDSLATRRGELLRLGVRHLVLARAWRLESPPPPPQRFGRRTPRPEVLLLPGTGSVPTQPVLTLLDAALRGVGREGGPAKLLVAQAVQRNRQLVAQVCQAARDELVAGGLLASRTRRLLKLVPSTRWELTPSGQAWRASAAASRRALSGDLRAGGAPAALALAAAAASPGLLLAGGDELLALLDAEVRRAMPSGSSPGSEAGPVEFGHESGGSPFGDLLDGFRGLGSLDFGISDGGDGDGGGGDGGGDGGGGGD